jgi:hypothetical protein
MVQLNRKNLSDEFDLEYIESEVQEINSEIKGPSIPDQIILMNIARANRLLDRMETEIQDGNMSARMCEVAAQLINSVTNASSQIMTDEYNRSYLQVRQNLVKLKEQEIRIKSRIAGTPKSQSIIFTDRESIMQILKQDSEITVDEPRQIEE